MPEGARPEPGSVVHFCPLPTCPWVHVEPPTSNWGGTFRDWVHQGEEDWFRQLEATIAEHVGTHTPLEWVSAIVRLRDRITELETRQP